MSSDIEALVLDEKGQMQSLMLPIISDCEPNENFDISSEQAETEMNVLALRNTILLPGIVMPIQVGRGKSKEVIRLANQSKEENLFVAVSQIDSQVEDPKERDLYTVGVIASIERVFEQQDGNLAVIIRGHQRVRILNYIQTEPTLRARVELLFETPIHSKRRSPESDAIGATIKENMIKLMRENFAVMPDALIEEIKRNMNTTYLVNFAIHVASIRLEAKQELLEEDSLRKRALRIISYQQTELQYISIKENLQNKTREEIDKQQREYFLQQQIRTIQEELGNTPGNDSELSDLRTQAKKKKWSDEVGEIFEKEIRKAERLHPQTPEYAVQAQYLRNFLSLPWGIYSVDDFNLTKAKRRLDQDHFGLEKVKERILEHLAVLKLKGDMKSPILCLYGPPGIGKTSLGRSIAESLKRKYVRISLGGVHDEAEIRGHRRTYIGAMSGRIIQSLAKAGTSNPVFVLDEIDKMGMDHKGSPESALLEVLDPEQNTTFHDNYLDVDYDLSKVLFIATANNIGQISQPLRDRMELIDVSGYITEEKIEIAKKHLVPKVLEEHGLAGRKIRFQPKALELIIERYTRESGVRSLNKKISAVLRKIAWKEAIGEEIKTDITPLMVEEYLGKPLYSRDRYQDNELPGVVIGLAWTSVGGEILFIESSLHSGQTAKVTLTGNLGDVMKESATIALSYIRAHQSELGIDPDALKDKEIHVHVPDGAVPKDGPSAGITMVTSMVSALTRRKVRPRLAMTGEVTLRGKVLPVGGIKEKILAAKRAGVETIILCSENEKDILEIGEQYTKGLTFYYVKEVSEVLAVALTDEVVE